MTNIEQPTAATDQQVRGVVTDEPTGEWQYDLCSCCETCGESCYACCCPCCYVVAIGLKSGDKKAKIWGIVTAVAVTLSAISQIITGIGIPCAQLPFAMVRRRIRIIRGIKGSLPMDCLCSAFCFCCVMVQAKREINVNDDDDCCAI